MLNMTVTADKSQRPITTCQGGISC